MKYITVAFFSLTLALRGRNVTLVFAFPARALNKIIMWKSEKFSKRERSSFERRWKIYETFFASALVTRSEVWKDTSRMYGIPGKQQQRRPSQTVFIGKIAVIISFIEFIIILIKYNWSVFVFLRSLCCGARKKSASKPLVNLVFLMTHELAHDKRTYN